MDTLRGSFFDDPATDDDRDYDLTENDTAREPPPSPIGQDERRMQVRAYNHWASLLTDHSFPSIEELEPENLPDFGPYGVLLDFTAGIDDPSIAYLGAELAVECGTDTALKQLDDVPTRSLLSRITDHYMQILANQAPIGFEAEFVNQRGATILYRGILLPFSSNDDTIDFIYGVINWKELADQFTTDELLLEIDQALEPKSGARPAPEPVPLTDWADGPAGGEPEGRNPVHGDGLPLFTDNDTVPDAVEAVSPAPEIQMELADWLASARELAQAARSSEDRTRSALYAAIGRAYDFSLAAGDAPEDFAEIVSDAGLTVQDRAPMTPVVKLVFGADYDKTRLTEYAAALNHGYRIGVARGEMAGFLSAAAGGLKGIVTEERRLRREEAGKPAQDDPGGALAAKLRAVQPIGFDTLDPDGSEFALLMVRRTEAGELVLLGEVPKDTALIERAAKRLLA